MAEGGIYDQLGGGFCRSSVDQAWSIPHFEKMLYDNGLLLALYAQFWLVSGEDLYRRIATETADWALRDMRSPGGGFFSALDADSEGQEGRFYVWTPDEVRELLSEPEFRIVGRFRPGRCGEFRRNEFRRWAFRWNRFDRTMASSGHHIDRIDRRIVRPK
jgi:uncharacterized protein YyaL (SSP411 family)